MEYNKIISVTGLGGLYELVGSKADGAIVRSLDDNTTKFISSRSHQFSHLESIEVYTIRENVNLADVLSAIKKSVEALPDYRDAAAVKKYFSKVYPDMDFDRVYASDMKKMVRWFGILDKHNIDFVAIANGTLADDAIAVEAAEVEPVETETKEPKKAKTTKKKTVETAEVEGEEKPKKKAAPKKKKTEE